MFGTDPVPVQALGLVTSARITYQLGRIASCKFRWLVEDLSVWGLAWDRSDHRISLAKVNYQYLNSEK